MARQMLQPAIVLPILSNALPIVGVLAWGWDVFLVLLVYWFETAIIGFWAILRVALLPPDALDGAPTTRPLPVAMFFVLHSGIFMIVHFVFLWSMFSGDWSQRVQGPVQFVERIVIDAGVWLPILVMFVVHGLHFACERAGYRPLRALGRSLWGGASEARPAVPEKPPTMSSIVSGFYLRIVAMQLAIIFGGMVAVAFGSLAPLVILIGLKMIGEMVAATHATQFPVGKVEAGQGAG